MNRFLIMLSIELLAVMVVGSLAMAQGPGSYDPRKPDLQYEVLSPWADVDPIQLRGISPRLTSFDGKKIGLYVNTKRAAMPIANAIDKELKDIFPDIDTIIFHSNLPNVNEIKTENKDKFIAWAKSVDAVIAVVGD